MSLPRISDVFPAYSKTVWAEAGWKLACDAAAEKDAAVFADLGPAPDTEAAPASSAYGLVAQQFAALGAKNFLFETLSSDVGIVEAVKALRVAVPVFSAPSMTPCWIAV